MFGTEMFYQLDHLVWAPFTFLWTYVTLPTLLVLLAIYFLNLYHRKSLYYISWNDSMSQKATLPEDSSELGHLPQRPGSTAHTCVSTAALVEPG
ncbi:putative orphan sodium- and chloride-dependent neurotransmitter transporter NTT5-like [Microtus ochrogaster]|uniref:Putative orphan sodium- and chloride-dependent neurotransmitter transporter NTT5-like n=1 Tax=Microtus ochrogaster TaxID=79684 RepID=A0A8J6GUM4_MICOH|nr:putative orphan sodium- and chloride-dependent neurotransmitter transporter NTT5-like [Microtus ochrogaster]